MNYTVLVVDDEHWIREALCKKVSNSGIDDIMVVSAGSYDEGLRVAEKTPPDILVCDIRMGGGADGLDLCKHIRAHRPSCRAIVVSGHDEFEYARAALQIGVSEYLLKPVSSFDIYCALRRSVSEVNEEREAAEAAAQRKTNAEIARVGRRCNRYLNEGSQRLDRLFTAATREGGRVLSFCVYWRSVADHNIAELIHKVLKKWEPVWTVGVNVVHCQPSEKIELISLYLPHNLERSYDVPQDRLLGQRLRQDIMESAPLPVTVGVGRWTADYGTSLAEAKQSMKHRVLMPGHDVIQFDDISRRSSAPTLSSEQAFLLRYNLRASNTEGLRSNLDAIRASVDQDTAIYEAVHALYRRLIELAIEAVRSSDTAWISAPSDAYQFDSLVHLFAFLNDRFMRTANVQNSDVTNQHHGLIREMLAFIEDNLHEQISLATIAETQGINLSYLSTVFHKEVGRTFTEYVARARLEQAKVYLASGEYSIAHVAEMTGFLDAHYFSKAFKAHVGSTPSEFRLAHDDSRR